MDSKGASTGMPMTTWQRFVAKYYPIEAYEQKKLLPLMAMMFLICFNYTLLRDLKDVLVLGDMNPASILYLKVLFVLPASVITMLVFTKLSINYSKQAVFYMFMGFFMAFYAIYGFILYPIASKIQFSPEWAQEMTNYTDVGLKGFWFCIAFWTSSLMYVMSELWGTVVLSLLFWSFANDICKVTEAKRFYTLINMGANFSLIFCGLILISIGLTSGKQGTKGSSWSMYVLMALVEIFAAIIVYIYWWMQKNVLTDPTLYDPTALRPKKTKAKLGFGESMKLICSSLYLGQIAILVIMYGVSVNFVEIFYKSAFKNHFKGNAGGMLAFTGSFSLCTGIVASNLLLWVGGSSVRVLGWTWTALITPLIIMGLGGPFMVMKVFDFYKFEVNAMAALIFGFVAVVLSKACKYSFFDPTKEMAYIPLDDDLRSKGKAAVDVVGARFGKSGSGILQLALLFITRSESVDGYVLYLTVLLMLGTSFWIWSSISLGRKFNAATAESNKAVPMTEKTAA